MSLVQGITQYLKDSRAELRRVSWPSKETTKSHTLLVIGISLGVAVFLGALDYAFNLLLERFVL
ncbi:MAG: preprotein translocase subunit SecE [Patescibacteria group bacterium]